MKKEVEKIGLHCKIKKGKKFNLIMSPPFGRYMNPHKETGVFIGLYKGKLRRRRMIAFKDIILSVYKKDILWIK